jgi:two-component system, NarL family, nitrate/nitrite response regulator NarL
LGRPPGSIPCRQLGVQPYDPNVEHVCRELNHGLPVIRVGSRSTLYPEAAWARSTEYGVIELAAVEDYRLLVDGLRAWIQTQPDLHLAAVTATVDGLLQAPSRQYDVVLLNPLLRADPDPAVNVRRLIHAGHRVLVIDGSADLGMVARSLAAGAHGYLTRDHDAAALARTLRVIVAGGTAWSPGPTRAPGAKGLGRPPLSEREHRLLMAYVSGLTLDSAARSLGISPETARTYLKRIKAKYHQVGRPAYTKLDLAQQVRADCTLGVSHPSQPRAE